MTEPLSDPLSQAAEWWMIPQRIWAGPKRWLKGYALPMRGPVVAGGDPVPVAQIPAGARTQEFEDDFIIPGFRLDALLDVVGEGHRRIGSRQSIADLGRVLRIGRAT